MAILSPSILSADFANLERDIHNIEENGAHWVHVDVMDGLFVPNITIGLPVVRDIRRVTKLPLDVHLMIDRPIRYAEGFLKAGADWLTIHLEADTPENTMACLEKIRALGGKAGLALKPGTPAEAALPYLTKCDMILVMTVEPGFGGSFPPAPRHPLRPRPFPRNGRFCPRPPACPPPRRTRTSTEPSPPQIPIISSR